MTRYVYIGTYTFITRSDHRPDGIYVLCMNPATGQLEPVGSYPSGNNPSFVVVHPNKKFLYAVNEGREGTVSSFTIDPGTGGLTKLNSQPSHGADPCYLSFDPAGQYVMVANYSSGSLAALPIQADGSLAPASDHAHHFGTGPNTRRQEKAHAHSVRFDPSGRFALAADLGIDQVVVYRLDNGKLVEHGRGTVSPGSGPRHLEFDRSGKVLYVANELNSTVTACSWDSDSGMIVPFQTLSTLPEGYEGQTTVADIHLHPDGRYLYVSNRGHDSLAIFQVDQAGALQPLGHVSTQGGVPRNFAIDPEGKFIIAANQEGNSLVVFAIREDGALDPTGQVLEVPRPVCVQIVDMD